MENCNRELREGKRSQGGQKKRYKDTLKASLKDFNIPTESWEQAAQDRTKWRCLMNKGASQFEDQRTNGPVNAHLISWPSKAQNIQNLENIW